MSGTVLVSIETIINYKSLAFDADTINKTFMKILNGETINEDNH